MKFFILISALLVVSSCTQSNSQSNRFMDRIEVEKEMELPVTNDIMVDRSYMERINSLVPLDDMFPYGQQKATTRPIDISDAPEDIDLRDMDTAVRDQGDEGTCTAFGLTAAQEYAHCMINQECGLDLSERYRWNLYKKYSADVALTTIKASIPDERFCPYSNSECYPIAKSEARYLIDSVTPLPTKSHVIDALAKGKAVYFWSQVPKQMADCAKTITTSTMINGGHAYKLSGYFNKADPKLILKNSWSESCGDQGYQYMSFKIFDKAGYWAAASIDSVSIDDRTSPKCRFQCKMLRKAVHFWEKRQYCQQICL
jgi:C1A family cysteine protease